MLDEIVREIDRRSEGRPFGELQRERVKVRGLRRLPNRTPFRSANHRDWAHHVGGRDELQFNLGIEPEQSEGNLRYGVAFSFEPSRSFPDARELAPKVALFNDYLRSKPEAFAEMQRWQWSGEIRSENGKCSEIEPFHLVDGSFVFFGKMTSTADPDFDAILRLFDQLMPLWSFIESEFSSVMNSNDISADPQIGPSETIAHIAERVISVSLRHNDIQRALLSYLQKAPGEVKIEAPAACGGSIDAVHRHDGQIVLYEIKTSVSPRECIRQAVGQLLEYAFWPGSDQPSRLVVVGENPTDSQCVRYLECLNYHSAIPISYLALTPSSELTN